MLRRWVARLICSFRQAPFKACDDPKAAHAPTYKRIDEVWEGSSYWSRECVERSAPDTSTHSFLVRRRFDQDDKCLFTMVDIKSTALVEALAVIMDQCGDLKFSSSELSIAPRTLFLFSEEIKKYGQAEHQIAPASELRQSQLHCQKLMEYIDKDFGVTRKNLIEHTARNTITFDLLWALFRPGEVIVSSTFDSWDHPRCFVCERVIERERGLVCRTTYWTVEGRYVDFDGKQFGWADVEVDIEAFHGVRTITDLPAFPLQYHLDAALLEKSLRLRGKRFLELSQPRHLVHDGQAFWQGQNEVRRLYDSGRVMIDPSTFKKLYPDYSFRELRCHDAERSPRISREAAIADLLSLTMKSESDDELATLSSTLMISDRTPSSEESLLYMPAVVNGFSFSRKMWLELTISGLEEVVYQDDMFASVVISESCKDTICSLVQDYKDGNTGLVKDRRTGKGNGRLFLLYGPPGVGKTLTVEATAEYFKCPRYTITAGKLPTNDVDLDTALSRIFELVHAWRAILHIDEADVFLEQRQRQDLHRNALVCMLLQKLEDFQGVLFFTTNRVQVIDDAVQSRMHLPIRYPELNREQRKCVWEMNLAKSSNGCGHSLTAGQIESLSARTLNGREIHNIVSVAYSLARAKDMTMSIDHITTLHSMNSDLKQDLGKSLSSEAMSSYT